MKQSKIPLWKKSCLEKLSLCEIREMLYEISENGDSYGYDGGDEGYYQDYKPLFDDLAGMAERLLESLDDYTCNADEYWDELTVGLLGENEKVLGYNTVEMDYFGFSNSYDEEEAVNVALKKIERITKRDLIKLFRKVFGIVLFFLDIKTAHDCLTSIVTELNEKSLIIDKKNKEINRMYEDYTCEDSKKLDEIIAKIPPNSRAWVE